MGASGAHTCCTIHAGRREERKGSGVNGVLLKHGVERDSAHTCASFVCVVSAGVGRLRSGACKREARYELFLLLQFVFFLIELPPGRLGVVEYQ